MELNSHVEYNAYSALMNLRLQCRMKKITARKFSMKFRNSSKWILFPEITQKHRYHRNAFEASHFKCKFRRNVCLITLKA